MSGLVFLYVSDADVFCYISEYICSQVSGTFKWVLGLVFFSSVLFLFPPHPQCNNTTS